MGRRAPYTTPTPSSGGNPSRSSSFSGFRLRFIICARLRTPSPIATGSWVAPIPAYGACFGSYGMNQRQGRVWERSGAHRASQVHGRKQRHAKPPPSLLVRFSHTYMCMWSVIHARNWGRFLSGTSAGNCTCGWSRNVGGNLPRYGRGLALLPA